MKRAVALVGLLVVASFATVWAQSSRTLPSTREEFEATLGYQSGTVTIKDGLATIRMPASFRFLGPEGSRRLLVDA